MSGENQYINPIIQAMMASSQIGQNAVKMKQTQQQQQALNDLAQQRVDAENDRIANEHEYQKQTIDNQTQLLQAQLAQMRNERQFRNLKDISDMAASGVDVGKAFPAGTPSEGGPPRILSPDEGATGDINHDFTTTEPTIRIPGIDQDIPVSAFNTPEKALALRSKLISTETTAKMAAEAPFIAAQQQKSFQNDLAIKRQDNAAAADRVTAQGANAERIARIHGAYELEASKQQGLNGIAIAKVNHALGYGDDDGQSQIAINNEDGVINGTMPYPTNPNMQRAVESVAAAKGHVLIKDKNYPDMLKGAASAQDLLTQMRTLAGNYSSDSPSATGGSVGNWIKSKLPMTDVASSMASLNSQINTVAKSVGINRTSNAEMNRLFEGAFDPMRSQQQNLQNIDKLAHALNTQVMSNFPKNVPRSQVNYVLGNRGLSDFGGGQDPTKNMIKTDEGLLINDTPQNRQLHGLPPAGQ
jgi:hypothetical protein